MIWLCKFQSAVPPTNPCASSAILLSHTHQAEETLHARILRDGGRSEARTLINMIVLMRIKTFFTCYYKNTNPRTHMADSRSDDGMVVDNCALTN